MWKDPLGDSGICDAARPCATHAVSCHAALKRNTEKCTLSLCSMQKDLLRWCRLATPEPIL